MDTPAGRLRTCYRFADLTLHVGEGRLRRGEQVIQLSRLTFALLQLLVVRAPDLVTHEEFAQKVWGPRRVVTPENLAQRIMILRHALGDDSARPRYIEGIRGVGYRLVPAVRCEVERGSAGDRSTLVRALSVLAVACAALIAFGWESRSARTAADTHIVPLTFDGGLKTSPRLSPSADVVAFAWSEPDHSATHIYVKQIARDAKALRITHAAAHDLNPSWSADGRQLAFIRIARGKAAIHVIPALGGRERHIVDVDGALEHERYFLPDLSWSRDGRFITYAEKASVQHPSRIMRVDTVTSAKVVLMNPILPNGAVGDFAPSLSPDGKRLAFVRGQSSFTNLDVWVADASGRGARQLTFNHFINCDTLRWVTNDELLLSAGDRYVQRSYSVNVEEGKPRPIPGLGENERWAHAQGDRIVFAKVTMQLLNVFRATTRNSGAPSIQDLAMVGSKVVFSPDGKYVAWQSRLDGKPQIWIANTDLSARRAMTAQTTGAFDPQWSPDSRHVVFESADFGNTGVLVLDVQRGRVAPLVVDDAQNRWPSYSRDGRFVYFSSNRDGTMGIYKVPAAGGAPILVSSDTGAYVSESHDRQYIYYVRPSDSSIRRMSLATGETTEIMRVPDWNRGWVMGLHGIYYLVPSDTGFAVRYRNLQTHADELLLEDTGPASFLTLSPDERTVLFSKDAQPTSELYVIENYR